MSERSEALDRITLTGIRAVGHHGVFDHERREGQPFLADVVLWLDLAPAARTGDLEATVDYGTLGQQVHDVLAGEPVDLIETVAERIADVGLGHAGVHRVEVTVHKPQAPIPVPFGDVAVTVIRSRTHPTQSASPSV
ncbi:dihydroneopterin aldolase [Aeromicrobium piscarium]|uniref:dihydroneopterin aldolase n=1 Tax=Aeromicrobium piscarium TaxID=2590901 RepID=UPI001C8F7115|nr:dihydroneopterin aldolase [Aeromicrobium piscarium]